MTTATAITPTDLPQQTFTPPITQNRKKVLRGKAVTFLKEVENDTRKTWAYIGKIRMIVQQILRFLGSMCKQFAIGCWCMQKRFREAIGGLKLLSAVSLPLNGLMISSEVKDLVRSIKEKDTEGALLTAASLSLLTVDTFDTALTFVSGVAALAPFTIPSGLTAVAMPMAFVMVTAGCALRGISLYHSDRFIKRFRRNMEEFVTNRTVNDREEIQKGVLAYLQKEVGITSAEMTKLEKLIEELEPDEAEKKTEQHIQQLLRRKASRLRRRANPRVVAQLQKLLYEVSNKETLTDDHIEAIGDLCKMIRKDVVRKMGGKVVGIVANVLTLIALALFLTVVPGMVGIGLIAAAWMIRLALLIYQDTLQNRGINYAPIMEKIQA